MTKEFTDAVLEQVEALKKEAPRKASWTNAVLGAVALHKGDTPGHEFHGNQHTAGEGGGGKTPDEQHAERKAFDAAQASKDNMHVSGSNNLNSRNAQNFHAGFRNSHTRTAERYKESHPEYAKLHEDAAAAHQEANKLSWGARGNTQTPEYRQAARKAADATNKARLTQQPGRPPIAAPIPPSSK